VQEEGALLSLRKHLRLLYEQARSAAALGWLNGLVAAKRNPLWVASYLAAPLSFLVLVRVFFKEEMVGFAIVGGLLMTVASNGISLMGDVVFYKRVVKLQEMVVASPMRPLAYLLGLVLSGLLFALPGLAIFGALMAVEGLLTLGNAASVCAASLLALASLSGLSFTLATMVKEERFVWPLTGILTFAFTVLPPVYYPCALLPKALQLAAVAVPTSNAAMLLQAHAGLLPLLPAPEPAVWAVGLAEAIAFLALAAKLSRWRER